MLGTAGCAIVAEGRAMGTTFRVLAHGGDGALGASAEQRILDLERRWSRFLPDSEISALNAGSGPVVVSPDTLRLVEALRTAWLATSGAFDPTLLGSLVRLGYAASREDPELITHLPPSIGSAGRPGLIEIDPARRLVSLPRGTALDPGGLGKGLAADVVVAELLAAGATAALVDIGGDLAVDGEPPDGAWAIALGDSPRGGMLVLRRGGVATSTTTRRRWTADGAARHHLLDPDDGLPTDEEVVTVTVVAGTAAWAEAFTKVAFVRGAEAARAEYAAAGLAASVTTRTGAVLDTPAWKEFHR